MTSTHAEWHRIGNLALLWMEHILGGVLAGLLVGAMMGWMYRPSWFLGRGPLLRVVHALFAIGIVGYGAVAIAIAVEPTKVPGIPHSPASRVQLSCLALTYIWVVVPRTRQRFRAAQPLVRSRQAVRSAGGRVTVSRACEYFCAGWIAVAFLALGGRLAIWLPGWLGQDGIASVPAIKVVGIAAGILYARAISGLLTSAIIDGIEGDWKLTRGRVFILAAIPLLVVISLAELAPQALYPLPWTTAAVLLGFALQLAALALGYLLTRDRPQTSLGTALSLSRRLLRQRLGSA